MPEKSHLEINHPELGEVSANTESLFATGHQVDAIAHQVYGPIDGFEIPYQGDLSIAVRETSELIASGAKPPIF